MKKCLLVCLLCFFAITSNAFQGGKIESFLYLKDTTAQLSITEVLELRSYFRPASKINPGYDSTPFWVLIEIPKLNETDIWYLYPDQRLINYIDYYVLRGDSLIKSGSLGTHQPKPTKELPITGYAISLKGAAEGDVILLRIKNEQGYLNTSFHIQDIRQLLLQNAKHDLTFYIFLGWGCFHLLFVLFQLLLYREKMYAWYLLFSLSIIMHQSFNLGYAQLVLPDGNYTFINQFRIFFSASGLIALIGFAYHVLDIETLFSKLIQSIFKTCIGLYSFILLIGIIPFPYYPVKYYLLLLYQLSTVLCLAFLLYMCIRAIRSGHRLAYYFSFVVLVIGISGAVFVIRNFGWIENQSYFEFYMLISGVFEMTLSLGIMTFYFNRLFIIRTRMEQSAVKQVGASITESHTDYEQNELEIFDRLSALMENEKLYLNPNLKLAHVAEVLEVPSHQLSKVINTCAKMHFFDFINSYRVLFAKDLLSDQDHTARYTLDSTAAMSGFNNRSSFFTAFKKLTNTTPSAYKKLQPETV